MISDVISETTPLDKAGRVILERWDVDFAVQKSDETAEVWAEPEYEDDLVLALAWIKNIG